MNMDRIKGALAVETGKGARSKIRMRPDVAEVVVDCVLRRRPYAEIAKRCGVDLMTVTRFRNKFITEEIKRIVLVEAHKDEVAGDNEVINRGQDDVQRGLRGIIDEQKEIYSLMKAKIGDGRDIEDLVPALAQLLRDTGQSFDRLLKSYTALKEKTTIVLSINEAPEWAKLQEVLYLVFEQHPEAFEMFRDLVQERRLRLE